MEETGAFAVFHHYEDENGDEQVKFIGIFATKERRGGGRCFEEDTRLR